MAGTSTRPRITVLEFKSKVDSQWWRHHGAGAAQDVFVTELCESGRFRVVEREQLRALMEEKNLTLGGDVDPATAVRVGKLLGVNYLLTGAVTEYRVAGEGGAGSSPDRRILIAEMNARLIDTSTGEIVWAGEARHEEPDATTRTGGSEDGRMFDSAMRPVIQRLTASLKAADL